MENPASHTRNSHRAPRWIFCKGKTDWWALRKVAILYSRFGGSPASIAQAANFIKQTVSDIQQGGAVVVSSYGTTAHHLTSIAAKGNALVIVCPEILPFMSVGRSRDFLKEYADFFDLENTLFISGLPLGARLSSSDRLRLRDELVCDLADAIHVGLIRPGGNMEELLDRAVKENVRVLRGPTRSGRAGDPVVSRPSAPVGKSAQTSFRGRSVVKRSESAPCYWLSELPHGYIVHYTRSSRGPWPGETLAEYYSGLLNRPLDPTHSAFGTLKRILAERKIRAGAKLSRNAVPVVSFTECAPSQVAKLRQWRKGLMRWSFEPYGVGFPKTALHELGARPVIYAPESCYRDLGDELGYLFHSHGKEGAEWYLEREWRMRHDMDITHSLWEKIVVITLSAEEARGIFETFGCDVFVADRVFADESTRRPGGKPEC